MGESEDRVVVQFEFNRIVQVFSQVLRDQINKFEEAFGTINIPTNPQAQPDASSKKPS